MPLLYWNGNFDNVRIERALGITIPRDRWIDVMDKFHLVFNAYKRKLGFATSMLQSSWRLKMWKHQSRGSALEQKEYSAYDGISTLMNNEDLDVLLAETAARPAWTLLHERIDPVLAHMTKMGMGVDVKVKAELSDTLTKELALLVTKMNTIVPEHVKSPAVWTTKERAEKGRLTMVKRLKDNGEDTSRLEAAEIYVVKGTTKVTKCSCCGVMNVKAEHKNRKFLKQESV